MKIIVFVAVVTLLVLPSLHAKPTDNMSLKQRILSELLQRMIEEQEEVLAQEEVNAESVDAEIMGNELEVAESRKYRSMYKLLQLLCVIINN